MAFSEIVHHSDENIVIIVSHFLSLVYEMFCFFVGWKRGVRVFVVTTSIIYSVFCTYCMMGKSSITRPAEYLRMAGIRCFHKDEKTIIVVEPQDEKLKRSIREFLDEKGFHDVKVLFLYDDW